MRLSPARLLDKLAGGVIPVERGEGDGFGDALRSRIRDAHGSWLSFAPGVDGSSIDFDTLASAREGADAAAREGFARALIDVGALSVRVDVPSRRVEARFPRTDPMTVGGIDGVVRVADPHAPAPDEASGDADGDTGGGGVGAASARVAGAGVIPFPARVVRNASLAEALVLDDVPDA
mgnify:CR=1 FL=1